MLLIILDIKQTNRQIISINLDVLSLLFIEAIKSHTNINYCNVLYIHQITKYKNKEREEKKNPEYNADSTMPKTIGVLITILIMPIIIKH